jgi:CheY-like chemotaxis protein
VKGRETVADTDTARQSSSSDKGIRYLIIVDGNSAELFKLSMMLQRLEYRVFTASTAEDVITTLEDVRPAAVLTEMVLPKMSGMDLLSRIKQDPRTRNIPVVVLTRLKDPKIEEIAKVAGCAAYLRKPVEPDTLYRVVQHAIETTPRHYIRLSACFKVDISGQGATGAVATTECVTALSENGVFIRTFRPAAVSSLLLITIFIGQRQIRAKAMVLYRITTISGPLGEPGMGMKFVEVDEDDRRFINAFIKDQIMQDLAL